MLATFLYTRTPTLLDVSLRTARRSLLLVRKNIALDNDEIFVHTKNFVHYRTSHFYVTLDTKPSFIDIFIDIENDLLLIITYEWKIQLNNEKNSTLNYKILIQNP